MKVRGGYKIRQSEDATSSQFDKDTGAQDFTIVVADGAQYLISSVVGIMAFTATLGLF